MVEFKVGEYVTRDGNKAVVLADDITSNFPLLGYIENDGKKLMMKWYAGGGYLLSQARPKDLMPPKRVVYANAYPNAYGNTHSTRKLADLNALPLRIACVRIEFEEGQYDD